MYIYVVKNTSRKNNEKKEVNNAKKFSLLPCSSVLLLLSFYFSLSLQPFPRIIGNFILNSLTNSEFYLFIKFVFNFFSAYILH